jgi:hypothetical protein
MQPAIIGSGYINKPPTVKEAYAVQETWEVARVASVPRTRTARFVSTRFDEGARFPSQRP